MGIARAVAWVGLAAGLGLGVGCLRIEPFECQRDAQCVIDGLGGICLLTQGTCVYPDSACVTGYSTADGRCVPAPAVDSGMPPAETDADGPGTDDGMSGSESTDTTEG